MLQWLSANLGTILISAALLVVVILIIRYLLRQKKAGKVLLRCRLRPLRHARPVPQPELQALNRAGGRHRQCLPLRLKGDVTMTETILKVDGMACGMCESHINDTVRNKFSVQKVTSSHTKGETVILSEQPLDQQALRDAIAATGYEVKAVDAHPYEKKGLFSFHRK